MPNYVYHEANVTGPEKVIQEFWCAHINHPEHLYFDFNTLIPRPAAYDRNSLSIEDFIAGVREDKSLEPVLEEKYGYPDWHDWSVANWGTKWNTCDGEFDRNVGWISMKFQTAWSMPEPIFGLIAELYPELEFNIKVCEEGGFFAGNLIIANGKVSYDLTDATDEWWEYAEEMMGWTRSEEGD